MQGGQLEWYGLEVIIVGESILEIEVISNKRKGCVNHHKTGNKHLPSQCWRPNRRDASQEAPK